MRRTARRSTAWFEVPVFLFWTLGMSGLSFIDPYITRWGFLCFAKIWAKGVFKIFRVQVEIETLKGDTLHPLEPLDETLPKPWILVANHKSPFDVPVVMSVMEGSLIANHRTASFPLVGWVAKKLNTIFVKRDDTHSRSATVRTMRQCLLEGRNFIIFPEGTTQEGPALLPFKQGAFVAAQSIPCTFIPVGIALEEGAAFTQEKLGVWMKMVQSKPHLKNHAVVGKPFVYKGDAHEPRQTSKTLCETLFSEVNALHQLANKRLQKRINHTQGLGTS